MPSDSVDIDRSFSDPEGELAPALRRELDTARRLARGAGAAAMRFYGSAVAMEKDGGSPVTQADHAANDLIRAGLARQFPTDAILSEESADSPERLGRERVWIVDPLDGTKEFLAQNGEFAVMIGLTVAGEPVVGAVYLPAHDILYSAARGAGAEVERNGQREQLRRGPAPDPGSLRLVGSRSHTDPLLLRMQEALGITDVRPSGSVGVKCALIAENARDLYIHPVPYMKEWDTCAPEIVLREAGGEVAACSGGRLRYNKADPRQPDGIVACAQGALASVLERIAPVYAERVAAGG